MIDFFLPTMLLLSLDLVGVRVCSAQKTLGIAFVCGVNILTCSYIFRAWCERQHQKRNNNKRSFYRKGRTKKIYCVYKHKSERKRKTRLFIGYSVSGLDADAAAAESDSNILFGCILFVLLLLLFMLCCLMSHALL